MTKALFRVGKNAYVEWSTTVDGPISFIMSKPELDARYPKEQVERTERLGHSFGDIDQAMTPEELIAGNRAGPGETTLSLEELLSEYAEEGS